MAKLKLTYFDFHGDAGSRRGSLCRSAGFHLRTSGSRAPIGSDARPTPFGALPLLERRRRDPHQSNAINRYVGGSRTSIRQILGRLRCATDHGWRTSRAGYRGDHVLSDEQRRRSARRWWSPLNSTLAGLAAAEAASAADTSPETGFVADLKGLRADPSPQNPACSIMCRRICRFPRRSQARRAL